MATTHSKDGTLIAYDSTGVGPPLILVSGALGTRLAGTALATALSEQFTVFTYDRRGRGDSGDTPPYAVQREIEDIDALIAEAGESAYLYGHSSGAVLALEATVHGLPVRKLAMYEPPFIVGDTRDPLPEDFVSRVKTMLSAGQRGDVVQYFMTTAVQVPAEIVLQMKQSPMWPALEKVAHSLEYDLAVMDGLMQGRPLPSERWSTVTVPTLAMDGGVSPEWARNAVQALVGALPNARRRTLEDQTHNVSVEVLAPVLREFFVE